MMYNNGKTGLGHPGYVLHRSNESDPLYKISKILHWITCVDNGVWH